MIDGVDQLDWLTGRSGTSAREGFVYWMGPEMYGAKWHDFKLALVAQTYMMDAPQRLATPRLTDLIADPQEREAVPLPYLHSWVATHLNRIIGDYYASVAREPTIPLGAPLGHVPVGSDDSG